MAAVVERIIDEHASLLQRIMSWQQAVYSEQTLPGWLRDSLINALHVISEVSVWAEARPPVGEWCREHDGLFAMNESPRSCPQFECLACGYQGSFPVAMLFPQLALSTLRGYKAYQFPDGSVPMLWGGLCGDSEGYEITKPALAYQTTTNGPCFVGMVDRYWRLTGDDEALKEFYPYVKKNTEFTMDLNRGPDGIVSMPDRIVSEGVTRETEWIEGAEWDGLVAHVGGIHLAHLRIAERMAQAVGDHEFAEQCQRWYEQGSASMEQKLWTGRYYLHSLEAETGRQSDLILSCQLDGDWITHSHGVPPAFDQNHAAVALDTIRHKCVPIADHGVVLFASPKDEMVRPDKVGYGPYGVLVSQTAMLAMNYMYHGDADFGLDICYRMIHNISCRQGLTWNLPAGIKGNTGRRLGGHDYYLLLIVWAIPAALKQQELAGMCKKGGLVDKLLQAGRCDQPR